jgi:hypothetical protein
MHSNRLYERIQVTMEWFSGILSED